MTLISCKNVCLSYENNTVIENLNFSVGEGDYLCIVGENGSGKSTLIKSMLGLKGTASGHLHMENGLTSKEIGYLPQQTTVQKDFPASVYEVVMSGCVSRRRNKLFFTSAEKSIVSENMKKLGISNLKSKCYRELSGGQQQRVLLARALCAGKKMLLLDEPVTGLDPIVTMELYNLIKMINKELGVTIIMVSHDLHAAVANADHILHLNKSDSFFGTTEEYLKSDIYRKFGGESADE